MKKEEEVKIEASTKESHIKGGNQYFYGGFFKKKIEPLVPGFVGST